MGTPMVAKTGPSAGEGPEVYRLARGYPAERAAAAVERLLGARVARIERSAVGSSHAVFFVWLDDGIRCVARLATHPEHGLDREVWATETARSNGLPVPRLIAADLTPLDGSPPAAVYEHLHGRPGHRVRLSASERAQVLEEMGHLAALLHAVRVPGVGRLAPAGTGYAGTDSSWTEFVLASFDRRLVELRAVGDPLPDRTERSLRERFAAGRPVLDAVLGGSARSSLVHGDFRLENALLVRNRGGGVRVSALLDFEMVLAGDGIVDLAWLHYQDGRGVVGLPAMLRGYGADPSDPQLLERLLLHQLHYALGHLWWLASFDDRSGAARIVKRIEALVHWGPAGTAPI